MSRCTEFHHPMLHKNNIVMDTVNVIDENKNQVILRIVPVKIRGKTKIKTSALCDEASTTTLIDHQTAKCIGLQETIVLFCCKWMSKVTKRYITSEKIGFEISGMANGAKWFNVNGARTIINLAFLEQTINAKFLEEKYPYLSKTLLEKIADAESKILIGQDNGILTVTRKVMSLR
jgi:hypothetical protein